jgi:hypothetical protein
MNMSWKMEADEQFGQRLDVASSAPNGRHCCGTACTSPSLNGQEERQLSTVNDVLFLSSGKL